MSAKPMYSRRAAVGVVLLIELDAVDSTAVWQGLGHRARRPPSPVNQGEFTLVGPSGRGKSTVPVAGLPAASAGSEHPRRAGSVGRAARWASSFKRRPPALAIGP
jgi:hypothetical protein